MSQLMAVGAHENKTNYNLEDFKNNKLNDNFFGLIQVEIETEHVKTKARLGQATRTSDSEKRLGQATGERSYA